ncbi:MAG: hypothetical protein E7K72_25510, partial [Roseomonas mucosa]|nr:hypothetical protein [Roseomonas mucosa]
MSGSTIPAWQRSVARTIVLPAASIPSTASLRWPTKSPDDDADYSIDIDSYLSDSADSIESIVASIAPYNGQASNLTITRADYSDSIITLWLHGGDAPR